MTGPLHPRGTLRARFLPATRDDMFRRLGIGARHCDLGDEGLYLAEELVAADRWLGGSDPLTLGVLVLALMIAQRQGSTRLPLDPRGPLKGLVADIVRLSNGPSSSPAGGDLDPAAILKSISKLTSEPGFDSVLGYGDARLPLIVDEDCLYTERSRWLEQRVAAQLAARLVEPAPGPGADATAPAPAPARPGLEVAEAIVADLRARPAARPLSDEQARAVAIALAGRLSVVTGGPGTGKTVVAAAIVRGFARLGVPARGELALAAQTGKAANRLTQVIAEQLASIANPDAADRTLAAAPPVAQTLHRLLGYRGGRFTHTAQNPLPVAAVLVDEASMIDLELIDALLDALPPTAPLVLVGDAHQLPAIDAGQILADLAEPGGAAGPRVAVLATSYRMDTGDPHGRAVYEAAAAVHAGEISRLVDRAHALATPRTPGTLTFRGVEWVDTAGATPRPTSGKAARVPTKEERATTAAVAEALWHHFDGPAALRAGHQVFRFAGGVIDPADADALEALWRQLGRARVLTVTRALPTGSIEINDHLHQLALDRMSVAGRPDFVPGEPVMITANDYQRGLFNGDQGIIVRAEEGLGRHHFRAVFRCGGELRPFAIEALRDRLELAWALTVHKSQGSELDAVALILPHDELPIVTRELIYTGITRARTGVAIAAAKPILLAGGKRVAQRHSGLAGRLARATQRR